MLGNPRVFLNTAADIHVLPRLLDAASHFEARPTADEMREVLAAQSMEPLFV